MTDKKGKRHDPASSAGQALAGQPQRASRAPKLMTKELGDHHPALVRQ